MALIFYMSSQPQDLSAETSGLVTELVYRLIAFLFGSTISLSEFFNSYGQLIRKLAHFTEFMVLGILAIANYREYSDNRKITVPFAFSVFYALCDEYHQYFVEGRFCSLKDVLIDSSGALCGILLYHLLVDRWIRKRYC